MTDTQVGSKDASSIAPGHLVLLRHGQSQWNLDNRFTGWVDVDLTDQGRAEAAAAGKLMKDEGLQFDVAHTSVLKRAIHTLQGALAELAKVGFDPVFGARPLKRAIQEHIENPLAKRILEGQFAAKDTVRVDVEGGKIAFAKG